MEVSITKEDIIIDGEGIDFSDINKAVSQKDKNGKIITKEVDNDKKKCYKLLLVDGSDKDILLSSSEAKSLTQKLRWNKPKQKKAEIVENADSTATSDEFISSAPNKKIDIDGLKRNLSGSRNVKFKNPELISYWASESKVPRRLSMGYEHARKEDIKDFDLQFSHLNVGMLSKSDGRIIVGNDVLLKTHIDTRDAIRKINYERRPLIENISRGVSAGHIQVEREY